MKQAGKIIVGVTLAVIAGTSALAQEYVMDENWPQPLPDGIEWGQVPNVTIDQDGNIYAFHRADPPVLKFDPSGKLIDSWGSGQVALPHGFRVAPDGTLWGTDYHPQNGHIVVRYDTNGRFCVYWRIVYKG